MRIWGQWAYRRILNLAWTIADLVSSDHIQTAHLAGAIQYITVIAEVPRRLPSMAIESAFQFDPTTLRVQDAHTSFHLEASNRVVYRQKDGLVLALGEPEEKVRARLSERHDWNAELCSRTLFGSDGAELPYELEAMERFTRLLHRQSQRARPNSHFLTKLVDGFDYLLTTEGYEAFPEARCSALEQSLQARLRVRRLVMNEEAVQIPLWKRNLDFFLRRFLILFVPLAAVVAGYLTMPRAVAARPLPFLAYLLVIVYSLHDAGKIVWMLVARRLVPSSYRLCMLQRQRASLSRGGPHVGQRPLGNSALIVAGCR
jgi:hypothetical protein